MSSSALVGVLPENLRPVPLTVGVVTPGSLDDQVLAFPAKRPPRAWFIAIGITSTFLLTGVALLCYTIYKGIGVWGNTSPVFWAFDIINFVFWVGIGHAGTLISAISVSYTHLTLPTK